MTGRRSFVLPPQGSRALHDNQQPLPYHAAQDPAPTRGSLSAGPTIHAGFPVGRAVALVPIGTRVVGATHPDWPKPGFYVMRLRSGAPLVTAIIYQLCPMVIPQPMNITGPHPEDWCRALDRSPHYQARVDGKRVDIDRVWTARSLRQVSREEFEFRIGPLRRWARENPSTPEANPQRPVDLNAIPPLF